MITVTRLNDVPLVINTDLIEFVESIPETIISLTSGKKVMVKESIDEIIARVENYQRKIYSGHITDSK
ncbi:MAG: flagellar FlbD family protein [candidate division Zixibacteria bacterium]|jgi:flagellar protein FlbD|nr:flagellar FlbD family protein [candidate division Zixibacteria bacterium]